MPDATFLTDIEIRDTELFTETARQWQTDFVQLDQGSFRAAIKQIGFNGTQLGECTLSRRLHQHGLSPQGGRTFIIQKMPFGDYVWRNFRPGENHMLCFPYNADFESVSPEGFHIYGLSIPLRTIVEKAVALEYPDNASLSLGMECVELSPQSIAQIRGQMEELLQWLEPIRAGWPGAFREYEAALDEVITNVISLWLDGSGTRVRLPALTRNRARILNKAMDHIQAHERRPLTVGDLCQVTGSSERTLQYTFQEHFQITPKQYLLARRLNGVRNEIRDRNGLLISEAAKNWGFSHMGQFAAKYRAVFGELPSETQSH